MSFKILEIAFYLSLNEIFRTFITFHCKFPS